MHKFFIPARNINSDRASITDKEQLRHIRGALRFKPGEKLIVFDEKGNNYACVVENISSEAVILIIREKIPAEEKTGITLTVACAIPKKSKFDDIIDKLTQIGAAKIIPLITERVVVKLGREKEAQRRQRWEKIALSASQQAKRSDLAVIDPVQSLKEVLKSSAAWDLKIIPTLEGERKPLKEVLAGHFGDTILNSHCDSRAGLNPPCEDHRIKYCVPSILVLIGPEGDFSPREVDLAKKAGCIPVSLGNSVLRVETAAVAVSSYIMLSS